MNVRGSESSVSRHSGSGQVAHDLLGRVLHRVEELLGLPVAVIVVLLGQGLAHETREGVEVVGLEQEPHREEVSLGVEAGPLERRDRRDPYQGRLDRKSVV